MWRVQSAGPVLSDSDEISIDVLANDTIPAGVTVSIGPKKVEGSDLTFDGIAIFFDGYLGLVATIGGFVAVPLVRGINWLVVFVGTLQGSDLTFAWKLEILRVDRSCAPKFPFSAAPGLRSRNLLRFQEAY